MPQIQRLKSYRARILDLFNKNENSNFNVHGTAVTIKRYRAVKEVGKIKMSVGVIAYYQLVQVCQAEYFRQLLKPVT
ncbi:hypothetical protein SCA6_019935 [Theobroma cacao]